MLDIPNHPHPKAKEVSLEEIRAVIGDCRRCELHQVRTNIVFGKGNPDARILIIGEAPGRNEDLEGMPFVGKAGKDLDNYLIEAGISPDDIYIANVIKCRPPENRNPKVEEITTCTPFLREQIRSIWPDFIVTLGNFSSKFILKTDKGITALRGQVYERGHFKVLPIFHPAAAIYDKKKAEFIKQDFALLKSLL